MSSFHTLPDENAIPPQMNGFAKVLLKIANHGHDDHFVADFFTVQPQ